MQESQSLRIHALPIFPEDPYRANQPEGRGINFYTKSFVHNEEWHQNPRNTAKVRRSSTMKSFGQSQVIAEESLAQEISPKNKLGRERFVTEDDGQRMGRESSDFVPGLEESGNKSRKRSIFARFLAKVLN